MIKINLTPLEELENPFWYIGDAIISIIIAVSSSYFAYDFVESLKSKVTKIEQETNLIQSKTRKIQSALAELKNLETDKTLLKESLKSLQDITVTRVSRFAPVIVLEHLQNLKPHGVWFDSIKEDSTTKSIEIYGNGFDGILIAEFISALTATQHQMLDTTDLRTQVFFSNVELDSVSSSTTSLSSGNSAVGAITGGSRSSGSGGVSSLSSFPELKNSSTYTIRATYEERKPNDTAPTLSTLPMNNNKRLSKAKTSKAKERY